MASAYVTTEKAEAKQTKGTSVSDGSVKKSLWQIGACPSLTD